jgi:dinuclear metal center YbgI/SA1388 family protein
VSEATRRGADLLVTHHPLFLNPLERLDLTTPSGRVVAESVRSGLGLYAAHTNLDRADGGVNDALATRLGLVDQQPFAPGEQQVKLVVTVPVGQESPVRDAIASACDGRLGDTLSRPFTFRVTGTVAPVDEAGSAAGRPGAGECVEQTRLEALVPRSRCDRVRRAVIGAHPWDEPAIEVYPLEGRSELGALGRMGRLAQPRVLGEWARDAARRLGAEGARLVGDLDAHVETVAVCGGSGAALWREAARAGAKVLVTGDVRYHTALEAAAGGMALLDVGHAPSEKVAPEVIQKVLNVWAKETGTELEVETFWEPDPFTLLQPWEPV